MDWILEITGESLDAAVLNFPSPLGQIRKAHQFLFKIMLV